MPHSSPISKSGLLFFNTLFDENAACHIALGQCYAKCFVDGAKLSPEEIAARGGNKSMIHIDWMIGSDKIDIDGDRCEGRAHAGVSQGRMGVSGEPAATRAMRSKPGSLRRPRLEEITVCGVKASASHSPGMIASKFASPSEYLFSLSRNCT